jgi:hypothetical protein
MRNLAPNCFIELADKIDVHLMLDQSPGYFLTEAEQRVIVLALRYTGRPSVNAVLSVMPNAAATAQVPPNTTGGALCPKPPCTAFPDCGCVAQPDAAATPKATADERWCLANNISCNDPTVAQTSEARLSEEERHAIEHARYQVGQASIVNLDCYLVKDLIRALDRAYPLSSAESK